MVNFLLKQGANVNAKTKVNKILVLIFIFYKQNGFNYMDTSLVHHSYKCIFFLFSSSKVILNKQYNFVQLFRTFHSHNLCQPHTTFIVELK